MRYRGPCIGSCHRHDLFFLSRLHIGEEIIGIVIAEADNRIGDANRSFVRFAVIRRLMIVLLPRMAAPTGRAAALGRHGQCPQRAVSDHMIAR